MAAPMNQNVAEKEVTKHKDFPSFIERYFIARYKTDESNFRALYFMATIVGTSKEEQKHFQWVKPDVNGRDSEDLCILQHSNKIVVITLARGHPILRDKMTVTKVDFQVTANTNRMNNKVIGKSKKGAQFLQNDSPLCTVHSSDGHFYTINSCVKGKLIEVNEALSSHPELIVEKPNTEGYVAIVLVRLSDCEAQFQKLLSEDEYTAVLASRADESHCPEAPPVHDSNEAGDDPLT